MEPIIRRITVSKEGEFTFRSLEKAVVEVNRRRRFQLPNVRLLRPACCALASLFGSRFGALTTCFHDPEHEGAVDILFASQPVVRPNEHPSRFELTLETTNELGAVQGLPAAEDLRTYVNDGGVRGIKWVLEALYDVPFSVELGSACALWDPPRPPLHACGPVLKPNPVTSALFAPPSTQKSAGADKANIRGKR